MPILVACPECNRKLRVPDDLVGQPVKCPTCNRLFHGEEPLDVLPATAPVPSLSLDDPRPSSNAADRSGYRPQSGGTKICPACREEIPAEATRCRFCAEELAPMPLRRWGNTQAAERELDDRERGGRRDWEPHRGTLVLVLGILSVAVPYAGIVLGIGAWILGQNDLRKMKALEMDPEGRSLTQAGWAFGIVGTLMQAMMWLSCGVMILPAILA